MLMYSHSSSSLGRLIGPFQPFLRPTIAAQADLFENFAYVDFNGMILFRNYQPGISIHYAPQILSPKIHALYPAHQLL